MSDRAIGDLSESGRVETRADLLAGSAGYQHFLRRLSGVVSPTEAHDAGERFHTGRRQFWLLAALFAIFYIVVNQWVGPWGLKASSWGNDFLRAMLLLGVVWLVKGKRVSVAGQLLMPLAALTFLPMPVIPEANWYHMPLVFGGMVAGLWLIGWCIDMGAERISGVAGELATRLFPLAGILLFWVLGLVAWQWVMDGAAFPLISVLAGALAAPGLLWMPREAGGDAAFLYAGAWRRWRFLIAGRSLAILMGLVPFLLFSNLLDYQKELEEARHAGEQHGEHHGGGGEGTVLRLPTYGNRIEAYFWREEGRFLREEDLSNPQARGGVVRKFYMPEPAYITLTETHVLAGGKADERPATRAESRPSGVLDTFYRVRDLEKEMESLDQKVMTREEFEAATEKFEVLQVMSREDLEHHQVTATDFLIRVKVLSFHPTSGWENGVCFFEDPSLSDYDEETLDVLIARYGWPKWLFFGFGIFGFIFIWRRGGDSSLARWIGLWLVGVSLIPMLTGSDDTLPHITHWLWRHSVMYRWNTLASIAQPMFAVLLGAAFIAASLWLSQISPALVWTYICWPTKVYPQFPAIVRHVLILGKLVAAAFVTMLVLGFTVLPVVLIMQKNPHGPRWQFMIFLFVMMAIFIAGGMIVRRFTRRHSEVPRLGIWPILAVIMLNLTVIFYIPTQMFPSREAPADIWSTLGFYSGLICLLIISYLILKRDFLRVRAIGSLALMLLLLLVPVAVNRLEYYTPMFLTQGPFFGERGSEMVVIMCVMLLFPWVHHVLHETLLKISVPKLRHIEHRVEHALEEIVDAEDDGTRNEMISHLFEHLQVKEYAFLSRRPRGVFVVDINKLGKEVPASVEFSEGLRKFLGHRHHFIDLQAMAYEWPFFFHQFELYRFAEATGCRYLLPIAVGESVRGLLLLPESAGGSVVSNPAVSPNINNLGIAAALNRPGKA